MTALGLTLLGVLGASAHTAAAGDTACDVYAAPPALGGSDANSGTATAPVATIGKLLAIVPAGTSDTDRGVACVHAGTYDFSADLEATLAKPWTTLRPVGAEPATLVGRLVVGVQARDSIVEGLKLNGFRPNAPQNPSLIVFGDRATIRNNEITNDHSEICVHVTDYYGDRAADVTIEGNDIHDCGARPHLNHDHGIYVANADRTRIIDNVIHDNQDRGVQLWPNADGSLVEGNLIDDNGEGINIGSAAAGQTSDNNIVRYNVITDSNANYPDPDGPGPAQENKHGWNIESVWASGAVGRGNVITANCLRADHPDPRYETNAGINLADSGGAPQGVEIDANVVVPVGGDAPRAYPQCSESALHPLAAPEESIPCPSLGPTAWQGAGGNDNRSGSALPDTLAGLAGNDTLAGLGSHDCLDGGIGADTLIGREAGSAWSPDTVLCGAGTDTARVDVTDTVAPDCERPVYAD